jgi:hypothetical protein
MGSTGLALLVQSSLIPALRGLIAVKRDVKEMEKYGLKPVVKVHIGQVLGSCQTLGEVIPDTLTMLIVRCNNQIILNHL